MEVIGNLKRRGAIADTLRGLDVGEEITLVNPTIREFRVWSSRASQIKIKEGINLETSTNDEKNSLTIRRNQ